VRLAVADGGRPPVDLLDAWTESRRGGDEPFLNSTLALIEAGPAVWRQVSEAAGSAGEHLRVERDVRWLCPLDRVPSLRDFLGFENHVKAGAERRGSAVPEYWYEAPIYYKGNHRSIIGPDEDCFWPAYTERLDFELELAMIVGRGGRNVGRDGAARHVFGFTVMNDFSARDIQALEVGAWLGPAKGKDFATALGPSIVTVDEVGAEPDLAMVCRVDGEEWGRARSGEMHWKWADMLAHVSLEEDVFPGDVYGSGTPGGCCGLDLGRSLRPGAVVELEIEKIGVLRNRISQPIPRTGR
jgi:2-keto-4-pentenoate hydratase/2-oxohepta-3-ene-1,7-dioic acid hydratase in catechol pathway